MIRIVLLLACWLLINGVKAQYPTYHNLTNENGLPCNEVYSITQDQNGYIWLGTDIGLYRYNGVTYFKYSSANQNSAALSNLTTDSNGNLYAVSFSNQLYCLQNDSLHLIDSWQGKRHTGFTNIAITTDNRLWASSDSGLYTYLPGNRQWQYIPASNNSVLNISRLSAYGSKVCFVAQTGAGMVANNTCVTYPVQLQKGHSTILSNYIPVATATGAYIIGIENGFYQLTGNQFVPVQCAQLTKLLQGRKVTGAVYRGNLLYILTRSGMVLYNPATNSCKLWYSGTAFSGCLTNNNGRLWLTTLQNGVYYLPNNQLLSYNTSTPGIPHQQVTHITSSRHMVYAAFQNGAICSLDSTGNITTLRPADNTDPGELYTDNNGTVLYNINNRLYCIAGKQQVLITDSAGPVKKIIPAGDNYIVATSLGAKAYTTNWQYINTLTTMWARDGLYSNGTLYIATNAGILTGNYTGGTFSNTKTLLQGIQVTAITGNMAANAVYALTFKGTLYRLRNQQADSITQLPNAAQPSHAVLHNNVLYIATNLGVYMFNTLTARIQLLNTTGGLATNDVHKLTVSSNKLWIATAKGIQCLPLPYLHAPDTCYVVLRAIKIAGNPVTTFNNLRFNYNQPLTLYPEAIAYYSMGNFSYAYRISTTDTNWNTVPADAGSIYIPRIPTGSFTLQLKVTDYAGNSSVNTITLQGTVVPPYWQRWWFYLLVATGSIVIVYALALNRIKYLQLRQAEKLEQVRLQNEVNLSQQAALKAQMNPHFIFNVLNSIKAYIYQNDKKAAAEYLSKFAQLMRKVLDASNAPVVKLADELEALELYIQLEAMQLEPTFEYHITTGTSTDTHSINIPSLIIQPFVENAIKHGLQHKQGHKQLFITTETLPGNQLLKITVQDNGIGRAASAKINSQRINHTPFATIASAQRLNLLNNNSTQKVSVTFTDLYDNQGNSTGTIAQLIISI